MRSASLFNPWAGHGYYSLDIYTYPSYCIDTLTKGLETFVFQETQLVARTHNCDEERLRPTGSYLYYLFMILHYSPSTRTRTADMIFKP